MFSDTAPLDVLIVDRSRPARITDEDFRSWAESQTIFVSSVISGMERERAAIGDVLGALGAQAIFFEKFGGRDDDAESAYLDGVRGSDIYVGVLGPRYGRPAPSGYSATHAEYDEALAHGLRISIWVTDQDLDGRQRDFLEAIQVFHTTGSYDSPTRLAESVVMRLRELAAEAGSPWCKVGPAVFRAQRHQHDGTHVQIEAGIRDDGVLAALEAIRPANWGRGRAVRVTCDGRTRLVNIDDVSISVGPGRVRHVTVRGSRTDEPSFSSMMDVAVEGRSPEDLTELAVRVALFGELNPLGHLAFQAEMDDPFEELRALSISEDALPGIAGLLLVEAMVATGRAERLTSVRIGPCSTGRRRVSVEWIPRRRFSNSIPEHRSVDGEVAC